MSSTRYLRLPEIQFVLGQTQNVVHEVILLFRIPDGGDPKTCQFAIAADQITQFRRNLFDAEMLREQGIARSDFGRLEDLQGPVVA